jgi:hypothetical protein
LHATPLRGDGGINAQPWVGAGFKPALRRGNATQNGATHPSAHGMQRADSRREGCRRGQIRGHRKSDVPQRFVGANCVRPWI